MYITLILLQGFAISLWLYWLWQRRHLYHFALKFPGSLGLPFFGVLSFVANLNTAFSWFDRLFKSCKSYTVCVWVFSYPMLITSEPEFIEKVFSSPDLLTKAKNMYQPLTNYFGDGFGFSSGEKWHKSRKLFNPSFSHKVLISFLPVFHKAKTIALGKFDLLVGKGEHRLLDVIQKLGMNISLETTLGKTMKEGQEIDKKMVDNFNFARDAIRIHAFLNFVNLGGLYRFYRKYIKGRELYQTFIAGLARDRMNFLKCSAKVESKDNCQDSILTMKKTPNIFIDQAAEIYNKGILSWEQTLAELNTIVAASIETTAAAIHSTLVMLATHPDVQQKVFEEVREVFPEKDFVMSYEHLEQLPYLELVINETLRLCPSIPLIGRQVVEDTQLTKDILLPKGLQILISIFNLQRRTDIWGPKAEDFNPSNFLPENLADKHTYAYISFSKGHRNCIGWRYAYFMMKSLLAGFIRNYRFSTSTKYEDLKFSINMSLIFVNEPGLEIHPR